MITTDLTLPARIWTAAELRQLPAEMRDAILKTAAERAGVDYDEDADLTGFEAFRAGDMHGHSADTLPR